MASIVGAPNRSSDGTASQQPQLDRALPLPRLHQAPGDSLDLTPVRAAQVLPAGHGKLDHGRPENDTLLRLDRAVVPLALPRLPPVQLDGAWPADQCAQSIRPKARVVTRRARSAARPPRRARRRGASRRSPSPRPRARLPRRGRCSGCAPATASSAVLRLKALRIDGAEDDESRIDCMSGADDALDRHVAPEVGDPPAAGPKREPERDQTRGRAARREGRRAGRAGRSRVPTPARARAGGRGGPRRRNAPGRP